MILGIDQSLDGAIAVVSTLVCEVRDIPTVETRVGGKRRREHAPALALDLLRELVEEWQPELAAIEWLHSIPTRRGPGESEERFAGRAAASARTNFSLGAATYTYLTACAAVGLPVVRVAPRTWKRTFGLRGDKEAARQVALQRFPAAAPWLRRKRDHDRAEAILIAEHVRITRAQAA